VSIVRQAQALASVVPRSATVRADRGSGSPILRQPLENRSTGASLCQNDAGIGRSQQDL